MNDSGELGECTICGRAIYCKEVHYPILKTNYDAMSSPAGLYPNFSRDMAYRYIDAETNTIIHMCIGCGLKLPNSFHGDGQ